MTTPDTAGLPGVIYARISSVYGEKVDSLDNQSDRAAIIAAKMEIPVPPEWIFKERDSGHETVDTRLDLLKVRSLARSGKISTVFIHAWDRLSRTPEELVSVWKELQGHGVQVVCILNPVHLLDLAMAKMILRMQGMVGEMEWEYIRRRTTENKQNIRDKGKRVGEGGPLFGYRWVRSDDGKIGEQRAWEIDEPAARIVLKVFDLIGNQGLSTRKAMEWLNAHIEDYPPPSVYRCRKFKDERRVRWSYNIRKLILDVTYKGVATCSRKVKVGKRDFRDRPREDWKILDNAPTPAIIDPELWARANANLKRQYNGFERARRISERLNAEEFALFRGILRCASCGGHMRVMRIRQWNPEAKSHSGAGYKLAYKCDTRWNKLIAPEERVCSGRAVYDEKVRDAAWEAVVQVITQTGWIEAKAQMMKSCRPGEDVLRESLEAIGKDIAKTGRRIGNIIDQMADEDDREMVAELKLKAASLREEKKAQEARRDALAERVRGYDMLDIRCDEIVRDVHQLRAGLSDPSRLAWPDRRKIMDGLNARFRGDGNSLYLEVDLGLEDVSIPDGPFVVSGTPSRSSTRREQRLTLSFNVSELVESLELATA